MWRGLGLGFVLYPELDVVLDDLGCLSGVFLDCLMNEMRMDGCFGSLLVLLFVRRRGC